MNKFLSLFLLSLLLFSCSKKDEPMLMVDNTAITLYAGNKRFITTTNGTNVRFKSQNPYIAKVDETTGEVTAMTIGFTFIDVKSDQGSTIVSVKVNKRYDTYIEPCVDFSKTMSQIISRYGMPYSQTDTVISYVYPNNGVHIADQYLFNYNILSASAAVIHQDYVTDALHFLDERYWSAGLEDGMYLFVNGYSKDTITMLVAMTKMPGYKLYYIIYKPYPSYTRSDITNLKIDESLLQGLDQYRE